MLRVSFDIHGVIDERIEFFSELTKTLTKAGHEVHILTGPKITDAFINKLRRWGISYTHIFSITDHHQSVGTKIEYDSKGDPFMDDYLWDKTKADYCLKNQIDLHLDDSDAYSYFFKTPYARYLSKNKRNHYVKEK